MKCHCTEITLTQMPPNVCLIIVLCLNQPKQPQYVVGLISQWFPVFMKTVALWAIHKIPGTCNYWFPRNVKKSLLWLHLMLQQNPQTLWAGRKFQNVYWLFLFLIRPSKYIKYLRGSSSLLFSGEVHNKVLCISSLLDGKFTTANLSVTKTNILVLWLDDCGCNYIQWGFEMV